MDKNNIELYIVVFEPSVWSCLMSNPIEMRANILAQSNVPGMKCLLFVCNSFKYLRAS